MRPVVCFVPLAAAALLPVALSAQSIEVSFESGLGALDSTATALWAPSGPASDGVASAKANAAGGWQWSLATTFSGGDVDGDGALDGQEISALASNAAAKVTFDIIIDHGSSFAVPPVGTWFQINLAANSAAGGWQQKADIAAGVAGFGWHDEWTTGVATASLSYTFAQLGWSAGGEWYQLNFGSNSAASSQVGFYLDNIVISDGSATPVPEPSTYAAMAGLLALAFGLVKSRRGRR